MCVGDSRNLGSLLLMCFHAAKHSKVWDLVYVKLLGIISYAHKPT